MKDYYINDLGFALWKAAPYRRYQFLCDEVFGKGAVKIKRALSNDVTLQYSCVDEFLDFQKNFQKRLIRLKEKFEGTPSYSILLETVAQVASPDKWEWAFAKLAALDVMWNDFVFDPIRLDHQFPLEETYSEEVGIGKGKEEKRKGWACLPDCYEWYFDVDVFGDTVGAALRRVIEEAKEIAPPKMKCEVFPEYPWDDNAEAYRGRNKKKLLDELVGFLLEHNAKTEGKAELQSKVLPQLKYKINWGDAYYYGLACLGAYNPYRDAEQKKHLILKRNTQRFLKNEMYMQVMVRMKWYRGLNSFDFDEPDWTFYRSLARRTFCEHIDDGILMKDVVKEYEGEETIDEVSRHLAGLIFIDDDIEKDSHSCYVIMNPNAVNSYGTAADYLRELVKKGDKKGAYDDLRYDNY